MTTRPFNEGDTLASTSTTSNSNRAAVVVVGLKPDEEKLTLRSKRRDQVESSLSGSSNSSNTSHSHSESSNRSGSGEEGIESSCQCGGILVERPIDPSQGEDEVKEVGVVEVKGNEKGLETDMKGMKLSKQEGEGEEDGVLLLSKEGTTALDLLPPSSTTTPLLASPTLVSSSSTSSSTGTEGVKGDTFDRFTLPTPSQLSAASKCTVISESGSTILFSSLIHQRGRVVVVFLRHLWCGLCAQYVTALQSLSSSLPTSSITSPVPPLYILLISSGSPSLISIYRARLNCPFPLYVDPSRSLYKALGMTKKTLDGGKDLDKGSYLNQSGNGMKMFINSTKGAVGMIKDGRGLKGPGNGRQLGGEFVFGSVVSGGEGEGEKEGEGEGGRIECVYASRMSTTRNHGEVRDLFAAAGVNLSSEE